MKLIFLFTKKIQWTGCTQWQSYLFWRSFSTPPAKMCVISCLAFKLCLSCLSPLSCLSCPWWPSKPYDHLDHDDHLGHEHFDHDDHIKHDDKLDPHPPPPSNPLGQYDQKILLMNIFKNCPKCTWGGGFDFNIWECKTRFATLAKDIHHHSVFAEFMSNYITATHRHVTKLNNIK